jgi:K+-sensing histidine kinase KdpD
LLHERVSALAEDFRTPLTPVVASSSLLAEQLQADPESAEARLSQNIYRSAEELQARLSKLTEAGKTR